MRSLRFHWGWLTRWAYRWSGWRPFAIDPPPARYDRARAPRAIFINTSPLRRVKGPSTVQRVRLETARLRSIASLLTLKGILP